MSTSPHQDDLAEAFRTALLDWCISMHRSGEGYYPTRFGPAVRDRTGPQVVAFAVDLISTAPMEGTSGFRRMVELDRGGETLEHVILREPWRALFSDRIRQAAAFRLDSYGIEHPPA